MVRNKIRFSGAVQGVGFRYTAQHLANALSLTGWVRNEWDGSVLMEVQGRPEKIQKLIDGLERGTFIRIDRIEKEELPLEACECSFTIMDY